VIELVFPWALAGLALVPAAFLWGLLAPRGRPLTVGSLMLWRRVIGSGPAGKPSARVRLRDPILWLDAAALTLLVLAVAQPSIRTDRPVEPVATIVIDRTAAMAVVPVGKDRPRWQDAAAMVRRLLASSSDAPIRIVSVPDSSGAVATQATTVSEFLAQGDAAWAPLPVDRDVWATAAAEAAARTDRPVIVAAAVAPLVSLPPGTYVLAPGGDSANAGLARVAARVEGDRWWLLVAARAGAGAPPAALVIEADGKILTTRDVFPAGSAAADGLPVSSGQAAPRFSQEVFAMGSPSPSPQAALPREVTVRLEAAPPAPAARATDNASGSSATPSPRRPLRDGFAWDDAAYLSLTPSTHLRVVILGDSDLALRHALESRADTDVAVVAAGEKVDRGVADLVIANRAALPPGWDGPAVVILPPADVGPVHPIGTKVAAAWRVAADHPLGEALYLEPPKIGQVERFRLDPAAEVLVGTPDAPVIVTWQDAGARRLGVLLDIGEPATDWSRRASFPIFWSRAIDWLLPQDQRGVSYSTYAPLEPMTALGRLAPAEPGFHPAPRGRRVDANVTPGREPPGVAPDQRDARLGVSFIGSQAAFLSGPACDDSAAVGQAIRRATEAGRREALDPVWPFLAGAVLVVLVVRTGLAR
jgi:hypothetical protein